MKDMKKMSFESIFNWLYAAIFGRETVETWSSDDRTINHSVSRPVSVSYLSRISLIALMLLVLGGWNTQAWAGAGDITFYASIEASPSTGGTVSLSPGTSQPKTSSYKVFSGYQQTSATFSYSATVANSNYVFKGWSTSSTNNSGTTDNPMSKTYYGTGNLWGDATYNADKYYAIFARLTAQSTATLAFGTKLIGVGWSEGTTKSVTIDYVHAGKITATITGTNATEFSLSSSSSSQTKTVVSNNTNSETNSTIKVYFNPSSKGSKSAKLKISSNNDLTSIEINLSGTGQATVDPTFTNTIDTSYYVEAGPLNLASLWTSDNEKGTITYSKVSFKADVENETGATVPSISNDNMLSLGQAGTLVIQMHQAASTGYYEKTVKDTIRIKKRQNTIKIKGVANYSNSIYVDSYDNGLTLTADNTDYTNCPITNTQTAGKDIATFYQDDNVVYSSYKLGTATWTLSQPENYKYQAGSGSFTVEVVQQPAEECNVLKNDAEYKFNEMNDNTYVFDAPGDKVTFQIKKYSGATLNQDPVLKGYDVTTGKWVKLHDMSFTTSWEWKTYPINNTNIRKIKWESGGENSWKYIRFVSITRKTYLNIATDNSSTNGTLTINKKSDGSAINPGQTGVAQSKIYWSCAGGGNLKIACDNPHFSFSTKEITGTDCNNGTTDITVSYTNTEAGTETATVTVYNQMYRQTFTVKGVIEKADQLIIWNNDILRLGQSYTDVATANTLVTYESEDESIIRVDEDGEGHKTILTAVGTGTVNITATAEETSFYAEKSDTKSIKVTDKQIQWIDWNQSLFGLKLGGANVTMNAVAASDVEGCASSRLIEYNSSDKSVVKVVNNNQLQIVGVGTAIITAVQAGGFDTDGHDYERAETEKTVIVRDPNAPCESFAYQQGQEVKMDCGWNALDKQTKTSEINFNGIIPATGTLRYKGEYRKVAINYFDGTMTVEQYIPGENWQPVTGGDLGKPSIGTYKTANLTFDRRATKMRVKVTDGLGYHYFTDCQVTQARFIETTAPVDFNLNVGQQQNQVIYLSYSNITDGLSLTLAQGANSHFSVDKAYIEGTCGDAAKNVALTITYHPTAEETNAQDVLTITDGTTTCQVVLTGSATRVNRHIIWDHADETNIYTVQTETLSAEARTDLNELAGTVAFSLAGSSTAAGSVSAENVLSFTSAGVADVVAYTKDDPRYNVAPNVVKTFNVTLTPTQIQVAPTVNAITSGDLANINEVVLNGGKAVNTINGAEVEGTFAVTSGDVVNAGTNTLQLSFTPDNTNMYSGCTGTTTITVNKVTSTATPSASNIIYGQTLNSSTLTNTGTEGTWTWNTADNTAILPAGTHEGLAVHFTPASGNYTELDGTVSLTVLKADAEATPAITAITYGQKVSEAALTNTGATDGAWALVGVNADEVKNAGSYELNVHFTPTSSNYKEKDAKVTLTVNKAASVAIPTAAAIVEGQKVSESLLTNSGTAGTWTWDAAVADNTPAAGTYNYTVHFTPENANYTELTTTVQLQVNVPVYNFTNGKGDSDWSNPENWENGVVPTSDPDIIVTGALEINDSITVGSLTIQETGSVSVITNGTLTVNGVSNTLNSYGDIHVLNDGNLVLGNEAKLKVNDFILDAQLGNKTVASASGQVEGKENLNIKGDAFFEITFDPRGAIDYGWYDFTVPFEVNIADGIFRQGENNHLVDGRDFMLMDFSESTRSRGVTGWSYTHGVLYPGRIYSITFDDEVVQNTFLFKRRGSAAIGGENTFNATYTSGANTSYCGWNGLGNGTLVHAQLHDNNQKVQVYDHTNNVYITTEADEKAFAVGTAFFMQVKAAQPIVLETAQNSRPLLAPARSGAETGEFRLALTADGTDYAADRLWVSASEEATMEYTIGHDLIKMGTPAQAKMAQMWVPAGELNLCDVEMPMLNNNASTPVSIYAPKEGLYTLSVDRAPEDALLFLTKDGRVIWNLSMTPYLMELPKGTTENYGLRLVHTHTEVATGVDEIETAGVHGHKVIIDNMIYIITSDGAMYDMTGKKVF